MQIKWLGFVFIFSACGSMGFCAANAYRQEEYALRQLCSHIEYMICQLQYNQTPLPQLFQQLQEEASQPLRQVFVHICDEFASQSSQDANGCMIAAVNACEKLPAETRFCLLELGRSLGRFDLPGQLRGAESVHQLCKAKLSQLEEKRDLRIRSYQIFGLCAGAALAILLV